MSLIPYMYRSTDAGAPQLTGQAGALAAILDAVLVDGYGVGSAAKPPLGWSKEFSGVNQRVYRNSVSTGSGYRLRVDDTPAQYALLRGYEKMTSLNSGSGLVPDTTQSANGCLWIKSSSANATARPWFVIGNERCFYLFMQHNGGGANFELAYFAGDIISYAPADQHCFALTQNGLSSYSSGYGASYTFIPMTSNWDAVPTASNAALYVARAYTGAEGAAMLGAGTGAVVGIRCVWGGASGNSYYDVPAPINGGVISLPGLLLEGKYRLRGQYPGLLVPVATNAYGDMVEMEGWLLSKRHLAFAGSQYLGEVIFQLGQEWT